MRRSLYALILVILIYPVAATLGAVLPGGQAAVTPSVTVLLVRGPVHYDVVLPVTEDIRQRFAFLNRAGVPLDDPRAAWLVLGWGSHAVYTQTGSWKDVTAANLWRAASGDSAVMRADVWGRLPADMTLPALALDPAQFERLLSALRNSFAGPEPLALPNPGFTATDAFFAARGRFHILRTCNVWLGDMLRMAGIRFGRWTPTAHAVGLSHWLYHRGTPMP